MEAARRAPAITAGLAAETYKVAPWLLLHYRLVHFGPCSLCIENRR